MNFLHAIVLGIVEGITEFLPISSTGHLIMASALLKIPETEFLKTFEIAIQLGAILAVVVVSWHRLMTDRAVWTRIIVGFIPTAILGLFLYKTVKMLLGAPIVVVAALAVGGAILILFEKYHRQPMIPREDLSKMPLAHAAIIGVVQSFAFVPGVSRSAATIVGGMALGWTRTAIVEFSFLLAIPTMAAAAGLDLLKSGLSFTAGEYGLLAVGGAIAFIVALASLRWFLRYVRSHDFTAFGIYRIVAGIAFWLLVIR